MSGRRALIVLIAAAAVVVLAGRSSEPQAAAASSPLQMTILGDSYSSGEGDPPFYSDSNVPPIPDFLWCKAATAICNHCHRSTYAWGAVVYLALPGATPDESETSPGFHLVACSGAVIDDVVSRSNPNNANEPPQITHLSSLPSQDIVALTLSGNDAGFGDVVKLCAIVLHCQKKYMPTGPGLLDYISRLEPRLADALSQIASAARAKNPDARVILVGYPRLFPPDPAQCTHSHILFGSDEIRWVRTIADTFQTMEERAAAAAGVEQVEEVDAFRGHELCVGSGSSLAVVPINAVDTLITPLTQLQMHPTALGQKLMAQRVLDQIRSAPPAGTRTIVTSASIPGISEGARVTPMSEDGSRLGPTEYAAGTAVTSPDGTRYAALAAEGGPRVTIYSIPGERAAQFPVADVTGTFVFAWAPGGHDYIADNGDGCLTWDAATSHSRRVVCASAATGRPASVTFTPDGSGVVWVGDTQADPNTIAQFPDTVVYTDLASGRSRILQPAVNGLISGVAVSPDGAQVAYQMSPSPDQANAPIDVYVVSVAGGAPQLLDPAARHVTSSPVWLGASIAYSQVTGRDQNGEPTMMQVFEATPGGTPRQLTTLPHDIGRVTVQPEAGLPDGRTLLVTERGGDTCESYEVDSATGRARPLLAPTGGSDTVIAGVTADGTHALVLGGDFCGGSVDVPVIWLPLQGGDAPVIARAAGASLANSLPIAGR